jgi:DNA-binding transcriptional LysR family regulator
LLNSYNKSQLKLSAQYSELPCAYPNGMNLVENVRAMSDAAYHFSSSATGKSDNIEGNICITTTELLTAFILPPMVQKLRQIEPSIEIEIISTNEESNLNRREADIEIRSFRPSQPELIVKKLYDIKGHLYAATTYSSNWVILGQSTN